MKQTSLLDVPNEVLIMIAKQLGEKDLSHLVCTNQRLHAVLTEFLHVLAVQDKGHLPALFWAAINDHPSLIEIVLDHDFDVNAYLDIKGGMSWPNFELGDQRSTALQLAAGSGQLASVEVLLRRGAHVNQIDGYGATALICAVRGDGDISVIKKLVDTGEDFDVPDSIFKRTAFFWAVLDENFEIMKLLHERGASVEGVDKYGLTPLLFAIKMGEKDTIKTLVGMGASLERLDPAGWTPLAHAIKAGNKSVIQLLLELGANPDAVHADAKALQSPGDQLAASVEVASLED